MHNCINFTVFITVTYENRKKSRTYPIYKYKKNILVKNINPVSFDKVKFIDHSPSGIQVSLPFRFSLSLGYFLLRKHFRM